ncbi:HD domain protein [Desulfosporosinus acididurans]|uniref:HD domain protein n=1 Tax=Desulfosporosinus acididurans TaxID=476652 RepID=A0A0J1ILI8_9FIRM|nr:HD domain-containing protein [Desulfosporosinus acididurans]KLU65561.1 HD domain protein [Desulfosporosinus acididurans]
MTQSDVLYLTSWFENFTNRYTSSDLEIQANLQYKKGHSQRVRDNMLMIGADLRLDTDQMKLAEVIGLFHDVGRFEQYAKYHTFKDHLSEDHAILGVSILEREHILTDRVNESEIEIINKSIFNHNRRVIQGNICGTTLKFCQMIRDADKLDIFDQIINFYENPGKTPYLAVEKDHEDQRYSLEIIEGILSGKQISYSIVKYPIDIKLVRLSWLLDLTFSIALKTAQRKQYFERLKKFIPSTQDTLQVFMFIEQRLLQKAAAN